MARFRKLFTVKLHFWEAGTLRTLENFFESFEHALRYAEDNYHLNSVKIYDYYGECVHHHQNHKDRWDHGKEHHHDHDDDDDHYH